MLPDPVDVLGCGFGTIIDNNPIAHVQEKLLLHMNSYKCNTSVTSPLYDVQQVILAQVNKSFKPGYSFNHKQSKYGRKLSLMRGVSYETGCIGNAMQHRTFFGPMRMVGKMDRNMRRNVLSSTSLQRCFPTLTATLRPYAQKHTNNNNQLL